MNVNKANSTQVLITLRTTYQLAFYGDFNVSANQVKVTSLLAEAIKILEEDTNGTEPS